LDLNTANVAKNEKWQNRVKYIFDKGILAKPRDLMAFQRNPLLMRAKFPFSHNPTAKAT
jgi:hypothetical protein